MVAEINFPCSIFNITVDDVLRSQGAKPELIRARRPDIVADTQKAIDLGIQMAHPMGWIRELTVHKMQHERIFLEGDQFLSGELILKHLAGSTAVVFVMGSLGMELEQQIAATLQEDSALSYTLDSVGSVLAEEFVQYLENTIRTLATDHNQTTSLALSPGLIGWPVDEGQPQIYQILQPNPELLRLLPSAQMIPRKSISFVMGIGCPQGSGTPCNYCDLQERCPNRKSQ